MTSALAYGGSATAPEVKVDSCMAQMESIECSLEAIWQDLNSIRETIAPRPITDGQATPCPGGLYGRLVNHADALRSLRKFVSDLRDQVGG